MNHYHHWHWQNAYRTAPEKGTVVYYIRVDDVHHFSYTPLNLFHNKILKMNNFFKSEEDAKLNMEAMFKIGRFARSPS